MIYRFSKNLIFERFGENHSKNFRPPARLGNNKGGFLKRGFLNCNTPDVSKLARARWEAPYFPPSIDTIHFAPILFWIVF